MARGLPTLPPLPALSTPLADLKETFRGPTRRSNWVVPGLVMAGNRDALDVQDGVKAILGCGITAIVCLQSKQEMASSVSYRKRIAEVNSEMAFYEQPIPDQEVITDSLVELFVEELVEKLVDGKVLYVHCKGGHGRTGTVCALLLGKLYGLAASEAMVRVQLYHDTRHTPIFTASEYTLTEDGSSIEVLFPVQREQVIRLLGRGAAADAPADAVDASAPAVEEAVEPAPLPLVRDKSSVYGPGASKYAEDVLREWFETAAAAATTLNRAAAVRKEKGPGGDGERAVVLRKAEGLFREAVALRPDFEKGWLGLARALKFLGKTTEARAELLRGLDHCPGEDLLQQELAKLGATAAPSSSSDPSGGATAAAAETEPSGSSGTRADADGTAGLAAADGSAVAATADAAPEWRPRISKPRLVMLVGLPASGKSTFAKQLEKSGKAWTRLCQDELPGRSSLESALGKIAKDKQNQVIIDRCNEKASDRKAFLDLAFRPKDVVCVHFDMPAADCEERAAKRTDHPTIKYGGGRNAVRSKHEGFETPQLKEGFAEIVTISNFRDADHLLKCWGAEPPEVAPAGFFKFPTTPHVFDLTDGRILTESDRLLEPFEAAKFFDGKTVLVVEEKVDGANCGISLTQSYEPRFQNRAHYVTSTTATQWQALDSWWNEHGWAVCKLLEPEVEVLFGEWLWARHSVVYNKLPAYFVAFDIYNKREGRFCSARERDRRLEGLGIPVTPRIAERAFSSKKDLCDLLERHSDYGDGHLEGIYLRIDEPEEVGGGLWLRHRGKIVRADFVQGITDHWIHKEVQRNRLAWD